MTKKVARQSANGQFLKMERAKTRPVQMNLSGSEGARVVRSAAGRVIERHSEVIKRLAHR